MCYTLLLIGGWNFELCFLLNVDFLIGSLIIGWSAWTSVGVIYPLLGSVCGKPQWVCQAPLSQWDSTSVLIIFSCCKTEYHRLCDFKQHMFMPHSFCRSEVQAHLSWWGSGSHRLESRCQPGWNSHLRLGSSSGITQAVGRILILVVTGLRFLFALGWSRESHSATRGCPRSSSQGPLSTWQLAMSSETARACQSAVVASYVMWLIKGVTIPRVTGATHSQERGIVGCLPHPQSVESGQRLASGLVRVGLGQQCFLSLSHCYPP